MLLVEAQQYLLWLYTRITRRYELPLIDILEPAPSHKSRCQHYPITIITWLLPEHPDFFVASIMVVIVVVTLVQGRVEVLLSLYPGLAGIVTGYVRSGKTDL